MSDLLPIYGCSTEYEATPAFERLVINGQVFVSQGLAYLPEADADLIHAYQRTDRNSDNPEAAALLAEIRRRGLDV